MIMFFSQRLAGKSTAVINATLSASFNSYAENSRYLNEGLIQNMDIL